MCTESFTKKLPSGGHCSQRDTSLVIWKTSKVMRCITTFRSTTDCIYDRGHILQYSIIILTVVILVIKVKFSRNRPGVAQRVGRSLALLFHDHGTRSGRQHAPAAIDPRERPGTHFTGGWFRPRAGLDGRKPSSPPGFDPGPSKP